MYIGQTPTLVSGANVLLIYIINKGHTCPGTKVGACPTFCQGSTPDREIIHFFSFDPVNACVHQRMLMDNSFLALTQSTLALTDEF